MPFYPIFPGIPTPPSSHLTISVDTLILGALRQWLRSENEEYRLEIVIQLSELVRDNGDELSDETKLHLARLSSLIKERGLRDIQCSLQDESEKEDPPQSPVSNVFFD